MSPRRPDRSFLRIDLFYLKNPTPDVQIALREGQFNSGFAQILFNREIDFALVTARAITHLATPDYQLEFNRVVTELFQEHARFGIAQRVRIVFTGRNQRGAHLLDIAAVSDADWNSKAHPRIAVGPVRDR